MTQILIFIAFVVAGYGVGFVTEINPIELAGFQPFAAAALVIGLYGSVVGIDLNAIQKRRRLAIIVITVAVPLQILATAGLMWLIEPVSVSILVAVAMTQIDPLSVDTLLRDKDRMSEESKGILRVWASFDDPVTVLFGFLILLPLVTGEGSIVDVQSFTLYLAGNLVPAGLIYLLKRYSSLLDNKILETIVLIVVLVYAFFIEGYLLAAIAGLLLRPLPERFFSRAIFVLYHIIVFTVGMSLVAYGINWRLGFLIAVIEFFVIQPATTLIVFNGKPSDLLRISYAQQNGLTTLLMGIAFEALGIRILDILLPGIIIVNLMNLAVNRLYTWKEKQGLIEYEIAPDEPVKPTPKSEQPD